MSGAAAAAGLPTCASRRLSCRASMRRIQAANAAVSRARAQRERGPRRAPTKMRPPQKTQWVPVLTPRIRGSTRPLADTTPSMSPAMRGSRGGRASGQCRYELAATAARPPPARGRRCWLAVRPAAAPAFNRACRPVRLCPCEGGQGPAGHEGPIWPRPLDGALWRVQPAAANADRQLQCRQAALARARKKRALRWPPPAEGQRRTLA